MASRAEPRTQARSDADTHSQICHVLPSENLEMTLEQLATR